MCRVLALRGTEKCGSIEADDLGQEAARMRCLYFGSPWSLARGGLTTYLGNRDLIDRLGRLGSSSRGGLVYAGRIGVWLRPVGEMQLLAGQCEKNLSFPLGQKGWLLCCF
jgi:hypothetical protein